MFPVFAREIIVAGQGLPMLHHRLDGLEIVVKGALKGFPLS